MRVLLSLLLAAFALARAEGLPDPDAVFQHVLRVEIANAKGEMQSHSLHLWGPADCLRLRGLVVLGETSLENPIARDPAVRAACERQSLGILFAKASVASLDLATLLPRLADASGWEEMPELPLFFVGHSAGGPAARAMAIRHAERCFGLMQSRGGGPMGDPPFPDHIPSLMIVGQFDEFGGLMRTSEGVETAWEDPMRALVAHKRKFPNGLSAMAVEPGAGHFSWSVHNARVFARFLEQCAALGLEETEGRTRVRRIEPASGWRVPLNLRDAGHPVPASVADYAGDPAEASWLFDRESAEIFVAYHAGLGKRDQFVDWEDPVWIDAGARVYFTKIEWVGDGATFQTHPRPLPREPQQKRGENFLWPKAGEEVGHAEGDGPQVRAVVGPLETLGGNRLRLRPFALSPMDGRIRNSFLAYDEGDHSFRYTERVGMLPRTFRGLTEGRAQTIRFAPPEGLSLKNPSVPLLAESDAGLPVGFYVARGPARVEKGHLVLREVPARGRRPLEIEVVAYQMGSGLDPKVRMASPVSHVLLLE